MAGRGACSASRAQDPCFFIGTDHPDPLLEQSSGLFIQLEHGASTLEKRFRVLGMRPAFDSAKDEFARLEEGGQWFWLRCQASKE